MTQTTIAPVAIIITCFNLGRTIEEALGSAVAQTRPPAELLIVDDGSGDVYTTQVLGRLASAGHTVVRTPNRGVSAARNTGVDGTTSAYVVLLDGDDVLEPTYLERLAAYLDAHPGIGFVSCGMSSFGASREVWIPPAPTLVSSLTGGAVHISSMFRRELWIAVGGFDESLYGHEEVDFWTTALERGFAGAVLPEALLRYRVRRGSMYQRAIQERAHAALTERVYAKHRATLETHSEALLLAKERFIVEQEEQQKHLTSRRATLKAELHDVDGEIAELLAAFDAEGIRSVEFGELRRLSPISPIWGVDRGMPLDRHYIAQFLSRHHEDVRGRVLEIKDPAYTRMFGADRVMVSDVLDIDGTNPHATIVGDLRHATGIPDNTYDCFILTQTLGVIYEVQDALSEACRILKPGGVLLCTVPASGRIGCEEGQGLDGDFWRFTEASVRRLFAEVFAPEAFETAGFGNVLAGTAFLFGLAPNELLASELEPVDPFFPVVYGIRAVKPFPHESPTRASRPNLQSASEDVGVILMYHRVSHESGLPKLCIRPETFRSHVEYLRDEGYGVVTLAEMRRRLTSRLTGARCVAITFDDAYAETARWVTPILEACSAASTHFVVGAALDGQREFWWDALHRVFSSTQSLPASLSVRLPLEQIDVPTSTADQRRHAHDVLGEAFYMLPRDTRDAALRAVVDWSGLPAQAGDATRPMTPSEVVAMGQRPGTMIGAHTESHIWLPGCTCDELVAEFQPSKAKLEALLARPVTSVAYPYGAANPRVARMARQAGFEEGVTTEDRPVRVGDDPLMLPRIDVSSCDTATFARRLWDTSARGGESPRLPAQ